MNYTKRVVTIVGLSVLILYVGDAAWFQCRVLMNQNPVGEVQVSRYYAVPEKNNRVEFYYGDTEARDCVHSLFPHSGDKPCWYLNKHKQEQIDE